jgi:integrase
VPYIVKRFAAAAGLDPAQFSGHSLRAGLVTQAFINEVPIELIQQQTRHRTVDVLLRYRRENDKQARNVSGQLGL